MDITTHLIDLGGNKADVDTLLNLYLCIKSTEPDEMTLATSPADYGYNATLTVGATHQLTVLVRTDDTIDSFDFDFESYYAARADYLSRILSQFDLTITREKNSNKQCWTYTYHNK